MDCGGCGYTVALPVKIDWFDKQLPEETQVLLSSLRAVEQGDDS